MARIPAQVAVSISPPNFHTATFRINGKSVLVVHRFSQKAKQGLKDKMEAGTTAASKKKREKLNAEEVYNAARYRSPDGWDGFHAGAIRKAMISACRLVGFKMVLAKLCVFVEPDGYDKQEPQIPLVRIHAKPVKQEDMARVEGGNPYVTIRPAYHNWHAFVTIRWDADQFTLQDITNLLLRVGAQVGLCEGRPDSKNSAGQDWGLFTVEHKPEEAAA